MAYTVLEIHVGVIGAETYVHKDDDWRADVAATVVGLCFYGRCWYVTHAQDIR
jgi:hypothetical protein